MRKYERGQILLIVVLVMTVALTVGLSIASRTITEIRTGTEQDTSQRAFSAAEAGIEKALQEATGSSGSFDNAATYETTIQTIAGMELLLNNGAHILKDDASDLSLSTYPGYTNPWTGTIMIYWGSEADVCSTNPAANTMAALEILLITGDKSNPVLTHYPVDPCSSLNNVSSPRTDFNNFEEIGTGGRTIQGKELAFSKTISVTNGLLMRIIPLYSSTIIGVRGSVALPAQGKLITSIGTSDNTQRKIVGIQENPKLPLSFFPFVIFSPR